MTLPDAGTESERQPLLRQLSERKPKTREFTLWEQLWLAHMHQTFAKNLQLAVRGAVFAVLLAIPFLLPQTKEWVRPHTDVVGHGTFYDSSAVVMFLFTLYKSVGETVNFALSGVIGTAAACLNSWLLLVCFFPHESLPVIDAGDPVDSETYVLVWWAALIDGVLFTLLILGMNFDLSLKMFALSWHMGFWMSFLRFESEAHAAGALATFRLTLDGDLVRGLLMTVLGAAAAVLASLVPYPLWAIDQARITSQDVTSVLTDTWQGAIEWFAGESHNSIQRDRLVHNVEVLRSSIVSLQGHVANAWWECFGLGSVQNSRVLLDELNTLLLHTKDRLLAVMIAGGRAKFDAKHVRVMVMLQPNLNAVCTEAGALMRLVTDAAGDGNLDDDEVDNIREQEAATSKAIDALSTKFWCIEEALEKDMVFERAFCMHCCAYGRGVLDFASAMIESRSRQRPWQFRWALAGVQDKMWFARNGISICLTFAIGYMGYHDMIRAFDAGPAVTASLLLSTFIGSAMLKNMGRLQGVALGTACGQLAYALFAWCRWEGDLAVALFLFSWTLGTLYMYYSSAQFGYVGCLLAAFGAGNVLQGCSSNETYHPATLAYKVINCVVGILVMTAVDMVLVPAPACQLAYEAYMDFWAKHKSAINTLLDPEERVLRRQDNKLLDPLLSAESLSIEANKEPRFWRTPWRFGLWTDAMSYAFHIRINLVTIERSLAEGHQVKPQDLLKMLASPAFDTVKDHVLAKIEAVHVLLEALAWEKESDGFHNIDIEQASRSKPALARQLTFETTDSDEERYMADLHAALFEGADLSSSCHCSLEEDALSRLCVVFIALGGLLDHLDQLKHRLLREGA